MGVFVCQREREITQEGKSMTVMEKKQGADQRDLREMSSSLSFELFTDT